MKLSPFKTKATKESRTRNGGVGETLFTKIPHGQNGLLRGGVDPRGRASPPPSQLFRIRHHVSPEWPGSCENDFDSNCHRHHDKCLNTPAWIGSYGDDDGHRRCQPQMGWRNGLARKSNSGAGVVWEGSPFQRSRKMGNFRNFLNDRVDYLMTGANGVAPLTSSYSLEDVMVPSIPPSAHHTNLAGSVVKRRIFGSAEDLLDCLRDSQEATYNRGGFLNKYHPSPPSSPLSFRPPALPPMQRKNLGRDGGSIGTEKKRNRTKNSLLNLGFDNSDESSSSAMMSPSPDECLADGLCLGNWENSDYPVVQGFRASMSSPHGKPRNTKDDQNPHPLTDTASSLPLLIGDAPVSAAVSRHQTPTDAGNSTDAGTLNEMASVADKLSPDTLEETLVVLGPCPDVPAVDADARGDAASTRVSMEPAADTSARVSMEPAADASTCVSKEPKLDYKKDGDGSSLVEMETEAERKQWETAKKEGDFGHHLVKCNTQAFDAKDSESAKSADGAHVCSGPMDSIRSEILIQVKDQIRNDLRNSEDSSHPEHISKSSKQKDDDKQCNKDSSATTATTAIKSATVALSSSAAATVAGVQSNCSLKDVASVIAATTQKSAEGEQQSQEDEEKKRLKTKDRVSKSPKDVINFLELAESARQQYLQRKRETGRRNQSQAFCPEKNETQEMLCNLEKGKVSSSRVPFGEWNQANHIETRILKRDANDKDSQHLFPLDRSIKVGLEASRAAETTEHSSLNVSASMMHDGSRQASTGVAEAGELVASAVASVDRKGFQQNQQCCVESLAETENLQQKTEIKLTHLEGKNSGCSNSESAANILGNADKKKLMETKKEMLAVDQTMYKPTPLNESASKSTKRNLGFLALQNTKPLSKFKNPKPLFERSHVKPATSSTSSSASTSSFSSAAQSDVGYLQKSDATQALQKIQIQTSSQPLKPKTKSPVPLIQNSRAPLGAPNNRFHMPLPQQPTLEFSGSSEIIPPPIEFSASATTTRADGSTAGERYGITSGKIHEKKPVSTSQIKSGATHGTTLKTTHGTTHGITPGPKPGTTPGTAHGAIGLLGSTHDKKSRTTPGSAPVTTPGATPASTDKSKPGITIGQISGSTCKKIHEGMPGKRPENVHDTMNGSTYESAGEKLPAVASGSVQEGIAGVKLETSTRQTPTSKQEKMTGDVAGKASRLAAQCLPRSTLGNTDVVKPQISTPNIKPTTASTPKITAMKASATTSIVAADSVQTFISITPQYIHLSPSV